MTQPRTMHPDDLHGLEVHDAEGTKVGKVAGIYNDVETDKPEWAAVKTGFFGSHETLVPLVNATADDKGLSVPYTKDMIKEAPHHDPDAELSNEAEAALFTHYGVPYSGETVTAQTGTTGAPAGDAGDGVDGAYGAQDTSGANTDDAITRSEEQIRVGTRTEATGKARLRKYVVTEQVSQTVPVSHEEVTITREPITEANRTAAMRGKDLSEEEVEVTLHAERAVVGKETVPVERIQIGKETVTGEETVSDSVRKEVVEFEDGTTNAPDTRR